MRSVGVSLLTKCSLVDGNTTPLASPTSEVIQTKLSTILPSSTNLRVFNDAYVARHKSGVPDKGPSHLLHGLRARRLIDPTTQAESEKMLLERMRDATTEKIQLDDVRAGLETLKEWNSTPEVTRPYQDAARKHFPKASLLTEHAM